MDKPRVYAQFSGWYQDNLEPIFNEVTSMLIEKEKSHELKVPLGYWWNLFRKNSLALFEMLSGAHYSYQINMTLRFLMEMVADVDFIKKNPENITKQTIRFEKVANKAASVGGMTYAQMAKEGKNFHLFAYSSGERREEVGTVDRVKGAFSAQDFSFYDYLCCFTHFNYLAMVYDLDISQPHKAPFAAKERIHFVRFYPVLFEKIVHAIGDLCGSEKLSQYDCVGLEQVLAGLDLGCRYDAAKIEDSDGN